MKNYDIKKFIEDNSLDYSVEDTIYRSQFKKKIILRHSCGFVYETTNSAFIKLGRRCPRCMGGAKQTLEELKDKVYKLTGNEYTIISTEYVNSQTKITFKHNKCGKTFEMRPANFISNNRAQNGVSGNRCPHCFGHVKKTTEKFKEEVYERVQDDYIVLGEYKGTHEKIKMQHNTDTCHHIFEMRPKDFLKKNGNRCPQCRASVGERESIKWFKDNEIIFEHKVKIEGCKNALPLEFDFRVFDKNGNSILYEYDGRLHFEPWDETEESQLHLLKQQENDKIKDNFCRENKITLVRINYKEDLLERLKVLFNLNDYRKDSESE